MCYRCGRCCRNMFCLVPKHENSNLDPDFTDKLEEEKGFEYADKYISENIADQGEKCKWLKQDEFFQNGKIEIATCLAYDRRSLMCRNYGYPFCNEGYTTWMKHKKNGFEIPDEILEKLKTHPMYKNENL